MSVLYISTISVYSEMIKINIHNLVCYFNCTDIPVKSFSIEYSVNRNFQCRFSITEFFFKISVIILNFQ